MSSKRRALLVGATGLVGKRLLGRLLDDDAYDRINTLGRRVPNVEHERAVHHVTDFWEPDLEVPPTNVLFCCLGTTIKDAGSPAAFHSIDFELVVNTATSAAAAGADTLIVISSVGADRESKNLYLRTKGEMEQAVTSLNYRKCGIVRPSLLLGARERLRPTEQLGKFAAHIVNPLLIGNLSKYRGVDADVVASAMIGLDRADFDGIRIVEGNDISASGA